MYEVKGDGYSDEYHATNHQFRKPFFMTLLSFVAMAMCLVIHLCHKRRTRSAPPRGLPYLPTHSSQLSDPLLSSTEQAAPPE